MILFSPSLQVAVYGGLTDRVHDLLLCGVDPSLDELSASLSHLKNDEDREIDSLLQAASRPWTPSHHAYLYGPEFKACIASICLVKVKRQFLNYSDLVF